MNEMRKRGVTAGALGAVFEDDVLPNRSLSQSHGPWLETARCPMDFQRKRRKFPLERGVLNGPLNEIVASLVQFNLRRAGCHFYGPQLLPERMDPFGGPPCLDRPLLTWAAGAPECVSAVSTRGLRQVGRGGERGSGSSYTLPSSLRDSPVFSQGGRAGGLTRLLWQRRCDGERPTRLRLPGGRISLTLCPASRGAGCGGSQWGLHGGRCPHGAAAQPSQAHGVSGEC